ncbi:MAG: tRNA (adenosine(37)-N6)-threonylcarbamoyltransferase complex ATPase subunit type 1 TsaE [Gammaproteobacteria bacterium]
MIKIQSKTPANTEAAAAKLAPLLSPPARIYLSGGIGGGKTTWTRALLRALGERGIVPSPTFALALSYQTAHFVVHHLDLFREGGEAGADLRELVDDEKAVCILEWPGEDLPPPDVSMHFAFAKKGEGRTITMRAGNERAGRWLRACC